MDTSGTDTPARAATSARVSRRPDGPLSDAIATA
jgi:hypothetical protein